MTLLISVLDDVGKRSAARVNALLAMLAEGWEAGTADKGELVRLLRKLTEGRLRPPDQVFEAARLCLLHGNDTLEDFEAAASFCDGYPSSVSVAELRVLREQFREFASDYSYGLDIDDNVDPDWLRETGRELEELGDHFGINVQAYTQDLYEKADEIESERAAQDPPDDDDDHWARAEPAVDDVHRMFEGLENTLKNTKE